MRRYFIFILFLLTLNNEIKGQEKLEHNTLEHGILFSSRADSDDDFSFEINGIGLEVGYFFTKTLNSRGSLSFEIRLAYSQSTRNYENIVDLSDLQLFIEPIITQRTGILDYKNISISLPIKYRHNILRDKGLFILLGVNPYISLLSNSNWLYDEFEYDRENEVELERIENQEEKVKQGLLSLDILLAGIGFKRNKWMFDLYFSGGNVNMENEFINGMDKLSIVASFYYQL